MQGFPPWMSALDLALFYKRQEAAQLLLSARAQLQGMIGPAIQWATSSDSAEGVGLVCAAGAKPLDRNIFGFTMVQCAAGMGSAAAFEELVVQSRPERLELSRALFDVAVFRGGSAELVQRLIRLRADIDFQYSVPRDFRPVGRLLFGAYSLQHQLCLKATVLTTYAFHLHGSTPLLQAIRSAQFEAAAALIAAGARLDLCNCRGWTTADFARGPVGSTVSAAGTAGRSVRVPKGGIPPHVPTATSEVSF